MKPDARVLAGARVSYNNDASPGSTLIELLTQDRPGLLCDIATVISKSGGNIEVVLVDTEAKKAIDVFYVTRSGAKLSDDEAAGTGGGSDASRHTCVECPPSGWLATCKCCILHPYESLSSDFVPLRRAC